MAEGRALHRTLLFITKGLCLKFRALVVDTHEAFRRTVRSILQRAKGPRAPNSRALGSETTQSMDSGTYYSPTARALGPSGWRVEGLDELQYPVSTSSA